MNGKWTVPRACAQNQIHILPNVHLAPLSHVLGQVGSLTELTSEGRRKCFGGCLVSPKCIFQSLQILKQELGITLSLPSEPQRRGKTLYLHPHPDKKLSVNQIRESRHRCWSASALCGVGGYRTAAGVR